MGWFEHNKPLMLMLALQFSYACLILFTKAALSHGMSPRVFAVYRQAIATLFIAPIAYFSNRRKGTTPSLGIKSFCLVFVASLIGYTININIYSEGLDQASSAAASAITNLVPAITFLMATILGLEKVDLTSLRSIAKISGTLLCVGGAASIALLKGPKLLNTEFPQSFPHSGSEHWVQGCLLLFGSTCCWSTWLILQVPLTTNFPDSLSLSAWTCFLATIQSAIIALSLEHDPKAWTMNSRVELLCCLYAGVVGSAASTFIQAWCVSKRGPVFCAMFNPLCTVIVLVSGTLLLHEELYIGSLAGCVCVIVGLYVVVWGKAKDVEGIKREMDSDPGTSARTTVKDLEDESSQKSTQADLGEPLLIKKQANLQKEVVH